MKYNLILLFGFFMSSIAYASDHTDISVPTNLHIYSSSGDAFVKMPSQGCSTGGVYQLSHGHVRYEAIFSLLLAAQISGSKVRIHFDGCVNGSNPRGNIIGVYLK